MILAITSESTTPYKEQHLQLKTPLLRRCRRLVADREVFCGAFSSKKRVFCQAFLHKKADLLIQTKTTFKVHCLTFLHKKSNTTSYSPFYKKVTTQSSQTINLFYTKKRIYSTKNGKARYEPSRQTTFFRFLRAYTVLFYT